MYIQISDASWLLTQKLIDVSDNSVNRTDGAADLLLVL